MVFYGLNWPKWTVKTFTLLQKQNSLLKSRLDFLFIKESWKKCITMYHKSTKILSSSTTVFNIDNSLNSSWAANQVKARFYLFTQGFIHTSKINVVIKLLISVLPSQWVYLDSWLTIVLPVALINTSVMKAGWVVASTHHAGVLLLLWSKDQVTSWLLHTHTHTHTQTLRLDAKISSTFCFNSTSWSHNTPDKNWNSSGSTESWRFSKK